MSAVDALVDAGYVLALIVITLSLDGCTHIFSVSSKDLNFVLKSANIMVSSLWVTWMVNGLDDSGRPFSTMAMSKSSLITSPAFLRAVIIVSARITYSVMLLLLAFCRLV